METPNSYGHVNSLSIYERPTFDFDPFTQVRERYDMMVGHLEPLRRKLVEVPFELDRPYWIEDSKFDIDYHVRHLGLAPPGAADQLAEQVARIVGRHMDRARPLWEAYVIEGLADGRWALLQKMHHATIDGASGMILLKMFHDESPDSPQRHDKKPWTGEDPPANTELLQRASLNLLMNPMRQMRLTMNMVSEFANAAGFEGLGTAIDQSGNTFRAATRRIGRSSRSGPNVSLPTGPAPPTPWNKSVSPHRRFAMRTASLQNLKRLKDTTGGTLNDIVMAVCAGALRAYLIEHNALPDEPLRAMVPVSIRTGDEADPWTNRVSGLVAELPTDCDDPIERVARSRVAMDAAKQQFELIPAQSLVEATDYTAPVVAASAIRLVSQLRLADRVNSPINVVISNVPGPREPLYFAGAKLDAFFPVSTISDGVGLNITVQSYLDRMDFGLVADRDLVPDLWHLLDLHIDEIERLFEASGAEWAVQPGPPAMRIGGDGVEPVPPSSAAVEEMIAARAALDSDLLGRTGSRDSRRTGKKTSAAQKSTKKRTASKRKPAAKRS